MVTMTWESWQFFERVISVLGGFWIPLWITIIVIAGIIRWFGFRGV